MEWMTPEEARRFLGLDSLEELEEAVVEFELPVVLDRAGELEQVGTDGLREALFEHHRRKVGHRPDDPEWHAKVAKETKSAEDREKRRIKDHRRRLADRVSKRGGPGARPPGEVPQG